MYEIAEDTKICKGGRRVVQVYKKGGWTGEKYYPLIFRGDLCFFLRIQKADKKSYRNNLDFDYCFNQWDLSLIRHLRGGYYRISFRITLFKEMSRINLGGPIAPEVFDSS